MTVWTRRFRGGALAARRARRAVREALEGELTEERLHDVELLISELTTNSVRHAGCDETRELYMQADVDGRYLRLCLCDGGGGFEDVTPKPDLRRGGGYGLMLLDRLSKRWGILRDGGFCVWFEVERASYA
jgi:anti-sigma regulatory factor (Ser/Thr protein kinase)